MKILITGASGMLGHRLALHFSKSNEVYVTQYGPMINLKNCNSLPMDITKPIKTDLRPDILIHTAALTDVDYCEEHPTEAWQVNVTGTYNLLTAFPQARFIYISTDFVFDGSAGLYLETDHPRPVNIYGKTKYAAEKLLPENAMIIRTCIFGHNLTNAKQCLPEKIVNCLTFGTKVNLFHDLYSTPIYTGLLADYIQKGIEKELSGIWNMAGFDRVSKYQMGLKIAGLFGLNPDLIKATSCKSVHTVAKRPFDVSLASRKLNEAGITPPNLELSLKAFKEDYHEYQY